MRAAQGFNDVHADVLGDTAKPAAVNEGGTAFADKGQETVNLTARYAAFDVVPRALRRRDG